MTKTVYAEDTSPSCCGSLSNMAVKIFVSGTLVIAIISMVLIFVGITGIYTISTKDLLELKDSTIDSQAYSNVDAYAFNNVRGFGSCMDYYDAVINNETNPNYITNLYAKDLILQSCKSAQTPTVYFVVVVGVCVIISSIMSFMYWWSQRKYLYYYSYSILTLNLAILFAGIYLALNGVLDMNVHNYYFCDTINVEEYNEMASIASSLGNTFLCITGRNRGVEIPVVYTPTTDLESLTGFVSNVGVVTAGLSMGLFAILFFIGLFACNPPKRELEDTNTVVIS